VTASGVFPASPTQSFGYRADQGAEVGNIVINNWCSVEFVIYDVGAYHMGGNRTKPKGNGTWNAVQDYIGHPVPSNGNFIAPFRETCPDMRNITDPYCADMDKLRGQGVSLKIANLTHLSEIMQIEYALVVGTFNYDGSGLDCADPAKHPELYQNRIITDLDISPQDMQLKLDMCPGIQNRIKLRFRPQTSYDAGQCEAIDCAGTPEMKCPFYWFGRTYTDEQSKACKGKFRGIE
jgi:hypothetical protein